MMINVREEIGRDTLRFSNPDLRFDTKSLSFTSVVRPPEGYLA